MLPKHEARKVMPNTLSEMCFLRCLVLYVCTKREATPSFSPHLFLPKQTGNQILQYPQTGRGKKKKEKKKEKKKIKRKTKKEKRKEKRKENEKERENRERKEKEIERREKEREKEM